MHTANEMHSARYLSLFHETPGAAESTSLISIREIAEAPEPVGNVCVMPGLTDVKRDDFEDTSGTFSLLQFFLAPFL